MRCREVLGAWSGASAAATRRPKAALTDEMVTTLLARGLASDLTLMSSHHSKIGRQQMPGSDLAIGKSLITV